MELRTDILALIKQEELERAYNVAKLAIQILEAQVTRKVQLATDSNSMGLAAKPLLTLKCHQMLQGKERTQQNLFLTQIRWEDSQDDLDFQ